MPTSDETDDLRQIGLTSEGKAHLDAVMDSGWFESRQDAYRTAIAMALAGEVIASVEQVKGAVTAYNFDGGIDRDGRLRTLIGLFLPDLARTPARGAERLAHAGLAVLAERLQGNAECFLSEALGYEPPEEPLPAAPPES